MYLTYVDLEMPDDFDLDGKSSQIYDHVINRLHTNNEFKSALVAVAYRFKTVAECDDSFIELINQFSDSPVQPARFHQEKELFNFFVNGLALIESFCYGLYWLGSELNPNDFSINNLRHINPRNTRNKFNQFYGAEQISLSLSQLISSNEFIELEEVRNISAHRISHGRQFNVSFGSTSRDNTTTWINGIEINSQTIAIRRNWLSAQLKQLFGDLLVFVQKYY
jgi:hypothetical protein